MMLKEASKLDKVFSAKGLLVSIDCELTEAAFVAKLSKFTRKSFLPQVGCKPPLQVTGFRAALSQRWRYFFVHC